jgi:hypothetical protein
VEINLTGIDYNAKEYTFKETPLMIRPYPASMGSITFRDGAVVLTGAERAKIFKHSLTGWRNVNGADGKALTCNDEIKQTLFDFQVKLGIVELVEFVVTTAISYEKDKAELEKNS